MESISEAVNITMGNHVVWLGLCLRPIWPVEHQLTIMHVMNRITTHFPMSSHDGHYGPSDYHDGADDGDDDDDVDAHARGYPHGYG